MAARSRAAIPLLAAALAALLLLARADAAPQEDMVAPAPALPRLPPLSAAAPAPAPGAGAEVNTGLVAYSICDADYDSCDQACFAKYPFDEADYETPPPREYVACVEPCEYARGGIAARVSRASPRCQAPTVALSPAPAPSGYTAFWACLGCQAEYNACVSACDATYSYLLNERCLGICE